MQNSNKNTNETVPTDTKEKVLTCGLVMPISAIDGCPVEHWLEVKSIFTEAVSSIAAPKFVTKLVSEEEDVGVILKRIVQNVYSSDIIICDVSGKNANVMFELGMRLAFDKPTVIVKDDKTDYSFDTSVIEHLLYPRDLRFSRIVNFKAQLADKVLATYTKSLEQGHTTFLKNFGTFTVASLHEKKSSVEEIILERLDEMQRQITTIRKNEDPAFKSGKSFGTFGSFSSPLSTFDKARIKVLLESVIPELEKNKPNKLLPRDKKSLISLAVDHLMRDGVFLSNEALDYIESELQKRA